MEIERLNYPDASAYKFGATGVAVGNAAFDPNHPDYMWFVQTSESGIVEGYALLDTERPEFVYVYDVGVRPNKQGRRVGSALVSLLPRNK